MPEAWIIDAWRAPGASANIPSALCRRSAPQRLGSAVVERGLVTLCAGRGIAPAIIIERIH